MNTIDSTKQEGIVLTSTPTKIWATNSIRVGIEVSAPAGNAANILIKRIPTGGGTPTLTDDTASVRITPGSTFEGDDRYGTSWDIWAASSSGSAKANFYEVAK